MRFLILVFGLFCFGVSMAQAQMQGPMTALQLKELCDSRYDIDAGVCAGYVTAIAENVMGEGEDATRICLSPAIPPQAYVDNVRAVWAKYPPHPQDFAIDSVEFALRQQFSCPQ